MNLLQAHIQKDEENAVDSPPMMSTVRHKKNDFFLPIPSFKTPNPYTPIGPPAFKAARPRVGYIACSQTNSNLNYKLIITIEKLHKEIMHTYVHDD